MEKHKVGEGCEELLREVTFEQRPKGTGRPIWCVSGGRACEAEGTENMKARGREPHLEQQEGWCDSGSMSKWRGVVRSDEIRGP